jgi:hypothetical protein
MRADVIPEPFLREATGDNGLDRVDSIYSKISNRVGDGASGSLAKPRQRKGCA